MKKDSSIIILLCGLVAMIATLVFYFLAFSNIFTLPMRWVSLLFLLIVEVIGTIKALKGNRSILSITTVIVSAIHLIIVLGISLIFVNAFPFLIKRYILLNLFILTVVAVIDILLFYFDRRTNKFNKRYAYASVVIDQCYSKAKELLIEFKDYKELSEITQLLKYSNRSELCGNENAILSKLNEVQDMLKCEDNINAEKAMQEVKNLIKFRSVQAKRKGNF